MMKTVLITGAARGIGLATAEIFAENHYNIVLLDRDAPALAAAGERLPGRADIAGDMLPDLPAGEGGAGPRAGRACVHAGRRRSGG